MTTKLEKPEHTKVFNRAHADSRAPFCCANGMLAKILQWIDDSAIGYITTARGEVFAAQWDLEGVESETVVHNESHNLVMTPLGFIDGKPVFVGDDIEDGGPGDWTPGVAHPGNRVFTNCRWPDNAPVIQTKMTSHELRALLESYQDPLVMFSSPTNGSLKKLADGILGRAITDGQVVTNDKHEADLMRLGENLKGIAITQSDADRAARDMAVAKAVRTALLHDLWKAPFICPQDYHQINDRMNGVALSPILDTVK